MKGSGGIGRPLFLLAVTSLGLKCFCLFIEISIWESQSNLKVPGAFPCNTSDNYCVHSGHTSE